MIPSFEHASTSYKEDFVGTCFFATKFDTEKPFYFAIDCRSSEEKVLGQFPKAYALDPEVVTDGDSLTSLIDVLEPLRSTTHISIIGEQHFLAYDDSCIISTIPQVLVKNTLSGSSKNAEPKSSLEIRRRKSWKSANWFEKEKIESMRLQCS